jgi:hypothetical protein
VNHTPDQISQLVVHDLDEWAKTGAGCDRDERIRPLRLAQEHIGPLV